MLFISCRSLDSIWQQKAATENKVLASFSNWLTDMSTHFKALTFSLIFLLILQQQLRSAGLWSWAHLNSHYIKQKFSTKISSSSRLLFVCMRAKQSLRRCGHGVPDTINKISSFTLWLCSSLPLVASDHLCLSVVLTSHCSLVGGVSVCLLWSHSSL